MPPKFDPNPRQTLDHERSRWAALTVGKFVAGELVPSDPTLMDRVRRALSHAHRLASSTPREDWSQVSLQTAMDMWNALKKHPIHSLPRQALCCILYHSMELDMDHVWTDDDEESEVTYRRRELMQVSKTWRDVIQSTPRFWSVVDFGVDKQPERSLQRAPAGPLTLLCVTGPEWQSMHSRYPAIAAFNVLSRVVEMMVAGPITTDLISLLRQMDELPQIQTLVVDIQHLTPELDFHEGGRIPFTLPLMPRIRRLGISNGMHPSQSMLPSISRINTLTSLMLRHVSARSFPLSYLWEFLRNSPVLEALEVGLSGTVDIQHPGTLGPCNRLKRLHVHTSQAALVSALIDSIQAPVLSHLRLRFPDQFLDPDRGVRLTEIMRPNLFAWMSTIVKQSGGAGVRGLQVSTPLTRDANDSQALIALTGDINGSAVLDVQALVVEDPIPAESARVVATMTAAWAPHELAYTLPAAPWWSTHNMFAALRSSTVKHVRIACERPELLDTTLERYTGTLRPGVSAEVVALTDLRPFETQWECI